MAAPKTKKYTAKKATETAWETEDDSSFDSITRISAEIAALAGGAAAAATTIEAAPLPIAIPIFAAAASMLMNIITAAFWQDKPALLAAIKDLKQKQKNKKQHKRQMQASLAAINELAVNQSFKVDLKKLIEVKEFLYLLPERADYNLEANITVTGLDGVPLASFDLESFDMFNPPAEIQDVIASLNQNEVAKAANATTPEAVTTKPAFDVSTQPSPTSKKSSTIETEPANKNGPEPKKNKTL